MAGYAKYKGKTYFLEFKGKTKFGQKAKLKFLDKSKEFWVDANLVTECSAPQASGSSRFYPRESGGGEYCGGICPVGGFKCSAKNGPCHDCQ